MPQHVCKGPRNDRAEGTASEAWASWN